MLDEKEFRKPYWVDGEWIALGDGGRWSFPRPRVRIEPLVSDDGTTVAFGRQKPTFDRRYDDLVEAFLMADDGTDQGNAILRLAVDLLRRNYDLAGEHYATLLPWIEDDEQNAEMWEAIADVAFGRAPKRTASGSASPA